MEQQSREIQDLASPSKMQQSFSSLNSPVDSGVQLLDSESDQTSVMSSSGCDLLDMDGSLKELCSNLQEKLMTKSDIANQNVNSQLELAPPLTSSRDDIMNISLNSYELLDYTQANSSGQDQMHVSMSEEVNESLKLQLQEVADNMIATAETTEPEPVVVVEDKPVDTLIDEQIVFRRQRKKKSRSDTPKKRVSFHEDILNSTKIDDIHINHGFITIEPEGSTNFLLRGFRKKHDIVQGRYSWAAEGDSTYTDNATMNNREVQSDIYVQQQHRLSSLSSSSSASNSSSIDNDDAFEKPKTTNSKPKSSCLKKTSHRQIIDTNVVEETLATHRGRKKSETNLLDANIFGSLKNILTFSTSLPLTERGVPEGQEDKIYSMSEVSCGIDTSSSLVNPPEKRTKANVQLDMAKNNLKLTIQPMYQNNLPENVILCDSNVYEHRGISYSYEYDNFTKSFDYNHQKPKNSSIYQKILKEFNFFRKKATQEEDFVVVGDANQPTNAPPTAVEVHSLSHSSTSSEIDKGSSELSKYARSANMDWSDNESTSDSNTNMRHLHSPRRRVNRNHYTVAAATSYSTNISGNSKNAPAHGGLGGSSSKNSLINRFLRHVTTNKMLDLKLQKKLSRHRRQMHFDVSHKLLRAKFIRENVNIDKEIEHEIMKAKVKGVAAPSFAVSGAYTTLGSHQPLLVVISQTTLAIYERREQKSGNNAIMTLSFDNVNTIIIGPSGQTIHISTYCSDKQCMLITASSAITNDIMIQLEMAMRGRQDVTLPAIRQLNMTDMRNLRRIVSKQTPVHKDDEYFYYTILNAQENQTDNDSSSCQSYFGPNKEGPLMFKLSEAETRWETAYFILKAGILYVLSSPSNPEPMKVYPLLNGACHGAKRVHNCARPHTFQLILGGGILYLAAPDEYVASDWLQALIHAATGVYNNRERERSVAPATSLLMTSDQILLVREAFSCNILNNQHEHDPIKGAQVLSCAAIGDLTSFKLPSAEQSWCILEFACREVRESSGDWILYFPTNYELESFISLLEMLWNYNNEGESFPLMTLNGNDDVNKKCTVVNDALQKVWL